MIATVLLLSLGALAASDEGPFRDLSFEAALAEAGKAKKVVFVDFFTTWCAPCKKLDATTWKDEGVQAWLAEVAVPLKIDAEKERELAKRYGIEAYPMLLFATPDGEEIDRLIGYVEPEDFVTRAKNLLAGNSELDRLRALVASTKGVDFDAHMDLGQELARRGKHAEALEQLLWCWDYGLEHDTAYAGVRVSFLLSDLARLASRYPPAREALATRRDAAAREILAGRGTRSLARDLAALNRGLREPGQTLRVWDAIAEGEAYADQPELAAELRQTMSREVFDVLLEARRYQDLVDALEDEETIESEIARYQALVEQFADQEPNPMGAMLGLIVTKRGKEVEAYLGVGRRDEAQELIDALLELAPSASTFGSLVQHAARAGDEQAVEALLVRARATLDAKEITRLERKAKRAAK